ncbi:hypothetical protein HH214_08605 [Mucilaginibacter robiniae]|uniref:Uncharacterized protein n=1 Tax=Mucilaginibacter robiniae TaxID=2728022 RepID=A0A7L5DXV4_9SPHI|nr:hypothetical protein [Mucilaginibacter robiniae]QJD95930.1 hypothetical protein HH214_08605 [Mucilaginibacter robiniae]
MKQQDNRPSAGSVTMSLCSVLIADRRITVWHISLYLGILHLWQQSGCPPQVRISRELLMRKARFKSITTYHKYIRELCDFGYIRYMPTYDVYTGSAVEILTG